MLNQGKESSIPECLDDSDRMKFHLKVIYSTPGKVKFILVYWNNSVNLVNSTISYITLEI